MKFQNILITGGAGFVGANLAVDLKEKYPKIQITVLDNLIRRGSELNLPRLKKMGIKFIRGDIRNRKDLQLSGIDLLIECSAEPSVMAGITSSPEYLLDTNLGGAINCFELTRKNKADVIFLSTSRVYPIGQLNRLEFLEKETRFILSDKQTLPGASSDGISEQFPLNGIRSLYGATKLAAELLLQEYVENYGIKGIINRCGLITGPWQMGKVDQGVVVYWLAKHFFGRELSYIGYGGKGKQVRDFININDLFDLIDIQINNMNKFSGEIYNVGGGIKNSFSLLELTRKCQEITGHKVAIRHILKDRPGDIRIYLTDNSKITKAFNWQPKTNLDQTLQQIFNWIIDNENKLKEVL